MLYESGVWVSCSKAREYSTGAPWRPAVRERALPIIAPSRPMNLLKAASTVSLLTLASRVTGLVRDMLIAAAFGASALDRRLQRRLPHPQPAAPAVRRRRVLAGLRADPGRARASARATTPTRQLVDAVATVLLWALLVTCVVGVVGGAAVVWLMASGLRALRRRGA